MTSKVPQVSFVIPAYNAAGTLMATLDSLASQTMPDWEAVIVDDGSYDQTAELAQRRSQLDLRMRVIRQANGGASHARNRGIAEARGALVAFLDSDDWIAADFLETLVPLADEGRAVAYCAYRRILPSGRVSPVDWCPELEADPFGVLVQRCEPAIHCMLIGRDLLDAVGGFDTTLRTCEDWDLWLRIARTGTPFRGSPRPLASYRMRPFSLSTERAMGDDASRVMAIAMQPDPRVIKPASHYALGWQDAPGNRLAEQITRQCQRVAQGEQVDADWLATALGPDWREQAAVDPDDLISAIEAEAAKLPVLLRTVACQALLAAVRTRDFWLGCLLEDWRDMEHAARGAEAGGQGAGRWLAALIDIRRLPVAIDPVPGCDAVLLVCAPGTPARRDLALPLTVRLSREQLAQAILGLWGVAELARLARAWRSPLFLAAVVFEGAAMLLRHGTKSLDRVQRKRIAGTVMRRALARLIGGSAGSRVAVAPRDVAVLMFDTVMRGVAGVLATGIGTSQLAELLQLLAEEGYEAIGFEELAAARRGQQILPPRPLILVFADARSALDVDALATLPPAMKVAEVLFTPQEIVEELPAKAMADAPDISLRAGLRVRRMPIGSKSALRATQGWRAQLAAQCGPKSAVAAYCDVQGLSASILQQAGFQLVLSPGSEHARVEIVAPIIPALECCGSGAIGDVLENLRPAA